MRFRPVWAAAALSVGVCSCSQKDSGNESNERRTAEVSDCYEQAGEDFTQPQTERALFVIVDQSTGLDDHLRETVTENVKRLMQPGTSYAVYTFSAYSKGHYPTPVASGELAAPMPDDERPNLSVRRLNRLDQGLVKEAKRVTSEIDDALVEATGESSSNFANSEILASLKQMSEAIRKSKAKEKLVVVVSDLLEHSSSTSFYRNKQVRPIDPKTELEKAESKGLVADFNGASVAIVGAGLLSPESGADATRDTAALESLHKFWEEWFEASDANVVQYGQPDLITPLQWGQSDSDS